MKFSSVIRKFTVLLALATLSLTVMNCSKKDSEDPAPSSQVVGTWKITNLFIKQGNDAEQDFFPFAVLGEPCIANIAITFNSNGTVTGSVPTECQDAAEDFVGDVNQAKYELNGNNLILTYSDGSKETIPVTFDGNKMSWVYAETDGSTRIVFTKQ